MLAEVYLLSELPLLVAARWEAFSGFVPELSVVPTGVVGLQRIVSSADAAISVVRAVAESGMHVAVCLRCPQLTNLVRELLCPL